MSRIEGGEEETPGGPRRGDGSPEPGSIGASPAFRGAAGGNTPRRIDRQMMELINKVKSLERETAEMRSGCNIVEAVTASNKELTKLWTNTNKRERVEKEVTE